MLTEFINAFWPVYVFAALLMLMVWRFAVRMNNLGIVDIAWSYSFAPVALVGAATMGGDTVRRWLMAGMVMFWSVRLGTHLYFRVTRDHPREDVRYSFLRAEWGAKWQLRALFFFQLQAALIALLSAPFLIVELNVRPGMSWYEWAGILIWLLAVVGEAVADTQLKRFRADAQNQGRVCRVGLWNYSRHPNYFFEWLVWVAFYAFACGSPWGWLTIYCPALMLYFLLRVTGIPLTEKMSVLSKGSAYRDYQKNTSPFVPWFKRNTVQSN